MNASAVWRPTLLSRRVWAVLVAVILVAASVAASLRLQETLDVKPEPHEFNIGAWEIRHAPQKWLFLLGEFFRGAPPVASQDAHARRFFQLSREISVLESRHSDIEQRGEPLPAESLALLRQRLDERNEIENQVEATLEARITDVAGDLGLTRSFLELVWPPVDIEFTDGPHTLVTSPRDRIELRSSDLLRADLSIAEIEAIEGQTQAEGDVSALAFEVGGVGAYPAIIDYPADYRGALRVAAHEWMHHYLFFRPLGMRYYANNDMRTINETVADLVGTELADEVMRRWPLDSEAAPPRNGGSAEAPSIDLGAELRALRAQVEAMLEAGRIEEAETLMEDKRQELAAAGYRIRKLNQAYFAFTNLYAGESGSPAAVNPIGPKVDRLRRQSASLRDFVEMVSSITSVEDLDRLLAETALP